MSTCLVCGTVLEQEPSGTGAAFTTYVTCPKCGKFSYSGLAEVWLTDQDVIPYKGKISSWISEQNKLYLERPDISEETIPRVIEMPDKKIRDKFECVLKTLSNMDTGLTVNIENFNHCYLKDRVEFDSIMKKAIKHDYLRTYESGSFNMDGGFMYSGFTVDGLEFLEEIQQQNQDSKNIFVAFHFTDAIKEIYDNYISKAIEETGFISKRVSSSSTSTETTINDEIISLINSSKIVIADFSGQRNAVYFEAGYAMGKRIPVIWCCKKDEVADLSFDTRQYPHILWEDGADLQRQLVNRINAMK